MATVFSPLPESGLYGLACTVPRFYYTLLQISYTPILSKRACQGAMKYPLHEEL